MSEFDFNDVVAVMWWTSIRVVFVLLHWSTMTYVKHIPLTRVELFYSGT